MKGNNSRRNIRASLTIRALIEHKNEKRELFASNLSSDGMFLRTAAPFEIGAVVGLVFSVYNEDPVELKGKVAYTIKVSSEIEPEPGMGIIFIETPEDVRYRINYYINKQLAGDLTTEGNYIDESQFI
jgi:Tfp pilus assembly protein PilZ